MSSNGGKRKRQKDDEELEGTNFSNDDINQKQIDEIQKKKEVQNSQRYRDKKRGSNLINLRTNQSSKTVIKRVPNYQNFHDSQIAGPSTRNVPYVPPMHTAGLSTQNEPYIPESHLDSDDDIHDDISVQVSQNNTQNMDSQHSLPAPTYSSMYQNSSAHLQFQKDFFENDFGHSCDICDRLWFAKDLKIFVNNDTTLNIQFLRTMLGNVYVAEVKICSTCLTAINKNRVPPLSVYNGFKYPPFPQNLENFPLDLVTERLVSPRIPFMQIRRLRHVHGQFGIYGQVINVPIEVNTMVNSLPRNIDDDHSITVHIKRKKIHKSNYLCSIVNKRTIKAWLQHLKDSPLYTSYGITVDDSFFSGQGDLQDEIIYDEDGDNDISEQIPIDESLVARQQTLMWNDEMFLRIAPGEGNVPVSLLFDEHAEELSFPQIYLGQFRTFRDGVNATPFMMATSELRRSDRRGVTPQHLLYMAVKIMRIRIRDSLSIAIKHVGKGTTITKEQIESEDYIQGCIESNLAFLRTIPNSAYWLERKKDLYAMIRQYGKPTVFFTISANEIGWPKLLQLLHNLKYNSEISLEDTAELHYIKKSTLINEDAVTCAIYFNKLVNVLMKILQSKRYSPFKKYRIVNYFKKIEFQHGGSPHAHILAWLDNAPEDALGKDYNQAIDLIDYLISVSAAEASGNIKLQTHKHTFTCFKGIASKRMQKCRFDAPFMPIKTTMILTPMKDTEDGFEECKTKYNALRKKLENYEYDDFQKFYEDNNINSDQEYINVIRAGIDRPKVFPKRQPHEKWHNPFNPFIMNIVKSNTDFQFITEEYSCAAYVVEYINKTNRGVSYLQRKIIEVMDEHPEFDIFEITKNISINLLNHTEITSQEAAWYLLREPMSKSSTIIVYIPTVWPIERQRIKKTMKALSELDDDCTDIWKENWFDKYEKRPEDLENISLMQFVSKYHKNNKGEYAIRDEPRVIRYRSYDMATDLHEYKREMVTLHIPFRHEESEILAQMKFIKIYDENVDLILQKRKEFESNIDIEKTIQICRELCREEVVDDGEEIRDVAAATMEHGSGKHVKDTEVTVKTEVEVAVPSKEIHAIYIKEEPGLGQSVKCEPPSLVEEGILEDWTRATTMEHGSGKHVMDTEVTVKIEVEEAVASRELDANYIKEEPGLGQSVKSEPAWLVIEGIPEDCTRGTSAPAYAGSVNEACSKSLGDLLNIKHEPRDMDIEPTVHHHMNIHYKINQNTSAVKVENTIADDCGAAIPCKRMKKESFEDKLRGEQRGVPVTSTRATGRTRVARDIAERQIKEDADLDIGPTVLQHMDSHYRTDQIHTATLPICNEEADGILTPRPARALTSSHPPSVRPCSSSWSPQPGTSQLTTPWGQEGKRIMCKAAERSRLYRERHREEINQRRRDMRQRKTNKKIPATSAERNRNYRERNRQKINERRRDSRLRQQNV